MSFRKPKSLKHIPLPIAGYTLVHIANENFVALIFRSPGGIQAQLRFEHEVVLTKPDGSSESITAVKPGPTFNRDAAYEAFSALIEKVVTAAFAHANGDLELTFEEGTILQVKPDNYEAWHFQQPAPGSGSPSQHVYLTGYGGGLI